ncbi:MAG: M23 family metallopeptidase [Firmicutes bacterium]|nr:M23 family metallopeptidase [Bacillota bacterium]
MLKTRFHRLRLKLSLWSCDRWNNWRKWWGRFGKPIVNTGRRLLGAYILFVIAVGMIWVMRYRSPSQVPLSSGLEDPFPFTYTGDSDSTWGEPALDKPYLGSLWDYSLDAVDETEPGTVADEPTSQVVEEPITTPAESQASTAPVDESQAGAAPQPSRPTVASITLEHLEYPVPAATIATGYTLSTKWLTLGDWRPHLAVDFAANAGASVQAAAAGTVRQILTDDPYWGTIVVIAHGGGWSSSYSNVSSPEVAVGEQVGAGQLIGWLHENPPLEMLEPLHLHFILLHNEQAVDPTSKWR